jgi:hypothetical protein
LLPSPPGSGTVAIVQAGMAEQPEAEIVPGVLYEDCGYHPVLCTRASIEEDELTGISLLDGSIRSCSMLHCGAEVLDLAQVLAIKADFAAHIARRQGGAPLPPAAPTSRG